jgi:hypothetical protein
MDTLRRLNPNVQHAFEIGGIRILPGERRDIKLKISEMYMASPVYIPLTLIHGAMPGPRLYVTAAIHGNELNGIEMVRLVRGEVDPRLLRGTLLLVGISNPIAFMNMSRDLPDGRDLNRVFPGREEGSIASQIARTLYERVILRADHGIDLHTAGQGRTNLPHVRADMSLKPVARLASAFGAEIIFDMAGDKGMLRHAATQAGIPTIVYEAGEPMKFQKHLVRQGVAGIKNVMGELGMYEFPRVSPPFQMVVDERGWIRADKGGILLLNVQPGDIIRKGEDIAVIVKPFGTEVARIRAPYTGLVVGATTTPLSLPGSAVVNLAKLGPKHKLYKRLLKRQRLLFE